MEMCGCFKSDNTSNGISTGSVGSACDGTLTLLEVVKLYVFVESHRGAPVPSVRQKACHFERQNTKCVYRDRVFHRVHRSASLHQNTCMLTACSYRADVIRDSGKLTVTGSKVAKQRTPEADGSCLFSVTHFVLVFCVSYISN